MISLNNYILERLSTNKDEILLLPKTKDELFTVILKHFRSHIGDLNNIDVSKLKEEDFYALFHDLKDEIEKNKITEIDISDWKLKELYYDENRDRGMFERCDTLETIILPNELEVIGKCTFYNCRKLNNITIPDSVKTIREYVFGYCTGLQNIDISKSLISIGNEAFLNCSYLQNIDIPNSIISIGYGAFEGCKKLNITVPNERVKELVKKREFGVGGEIIIK